MTLVPQKACSVPVLSPPPRPTEICAADWAGPRRLRGGTCRCEDGWMGAVPGRPAPATRAARSTEPAATASAVQPGWNGEHCTIGMWAWPGLSGGLHAAQCLAGHSGEPIACGSWAKSPFIRFPLWSACPRQQLDLDSQSGDSNLFLSQPAFPGSQPAGSIPWACSAQAKWIQLCVKELGLKNEADDSTAEQL